MSYPFLPGSPNEWHSQFKEDGIFGTVSFQSGDMSKEPPGKNERIEDEIEAPERVRHN